MVRGRRRRRPHDVPETSCAPMNNPRSCSNYPLFHQEQRGGSEKVCDPLKVPHLTGDSNRTKDACTLPTGLPAATVSISSSSPCGRCWPEPSKPRLALSRVQQTLQRGPRQLRRDGWLPQPGQSTLFQGPSRDIPSHGDACRRPSTGGLNGAGTGEGPMAFASDDSPMTSRWAM